MRYFFLALLLTCVGCGSGEVVETGSKRLPTNAVVTQDLGNGWCVFTLTVNGKERKFLSRFYRSGNSSTDVMTELSE